MRFSFWFFLSFCFSPDLFNHCDLAKMADIRSEEERVLEDPVSTTVIFVIYAWYKVLTATTSYWFIVHEHPAVEADAAWLLRYIAEVLF